MNLFLIVVSTILLLPNFTEAGTADLELLIDKMENDVLELAEQVEEAFQDRCTTALNDCSYNNYDSCVSQFLSPTCYKSDELVTTCSSGPSDSCAALFDFNSSNVILPSEIADGKDGNPTNPQVNTCVLLLLVEQFRLMSKQECTNLLVIVPLFRTI